MTKISDTEYEKAITETAEVVEPKNQQLQPTESDILQFFGGSKTGKYTRFVLAALSSLPWVSVLSAVASFKAEGNQDKVNQIIGLWLQEHREKMIELGATIDEILTRLDGFDQEIQDRIESPEYLALVRKAFRSWDESDTKEKREMIKKLLINAGGTKLCPDDLVRLFIDWIDKYHEAHFSVIGEIYRNPGITRGQIWDNTHDSRPREDSPDADLFRYLISDLNLGRVIRIEREVNYSGEFVRKSTRGQHKGTPSSTLESAFEDTKPYELSGLGSQFVHYVMTDLVPRIGE